MSEPRRCPQCDAEIPANSPAGLCPRCLLKASADSQSGAAPAEPGPTKLTPPASGFVPPTVEELAPLFPQLEILELLGKGGMGAVYKARQPGLDRLVAVKILPPEISRDPAFAERFQREARALARLSHPHIVAVYDFGQTMDVGWPPSAVPHDAANADGRGRPSYYIVMEFVDGANLRQTIKAGKLAPDEALAIVPQICEALQFAHDEGIVHRDIKPENILIDKRGRVKIADFGLAKLMANGGRESPGESLTATHQVMGTLRYMAPEQMQGSREVDHRADIYSLGVVFYELLTGELPMGRFAPPSKKVQVDVRLDEIVLRALEQEPEQRYQQASEIKVDVDTISRSPRVARPESAKGVDGPGDTRATPFDDSGRGTQPVGLPFEIAGSVHWGLFGEVHGKLRLGRNAVVVEFEVRSLFSAFRSGLKEVSIPFDDIESVNWDGWELTLHTKSMRALAEIPNSSQGQVAFDLSMTDLDVPGGISEPVKHFLECLPPRFAGKSASVASPVSAKGAATEPRLVQAPADCLLLAAGIAFMTACGVAVWLLASPTSSVITSLVRGNLTVASVTLATYSLFIGVAGLLLRRLRARLFVLLAAVMAGLFFPAVIALNVVMEFRQTHEWLVAVPLWLGVPVAIWATIVLFRNDVRAAFEQQQRVNRALANALPPERRVNAPAIWLLLTGLFAAAHGVLLLIFMVLLFSESQFSHGELVLYRSLGAALLLAGSVICHGAWQMLHLRGYRWAVAAAILGQPLGIWSLVTLMRPDVRSAFQTQATSRGATASIPDSSTPLPAAASLRRWWLLPRTVTLLAALTGGALTAGPWQGVEIRAPFTQGNHIQWFLSPGYESVHGLAAGVLFALVFFVTLAAFHLRRAAVPTVTIIVGLIIASLIASYGYHPPLADRLEVADVVAKLQALKPELQVAGRSHLAVVREAAQSGMMDYWQRIIPAFYMSLAMSLLIVIAATLDLVLQRQGAPIESSSVAASASRPIGPEQISLWAAISGVVLPALLLLGGTMLSSRVSIRDGFLVVCFLPGVGLELVAFGCGLVARGTKSGKAGLIIGSISLVLCPIPLTTMIPTRDSTHNSHPDAISESTLALVPPLGTITNGIGAEFTVPAGQVATFEIVTRRDNETVPVPPHCGYVMAPPDTPVAGTFRWSRKPEEDVAVGRSRKWSLEIVTGGGGNGYTEAILLPDELNAAVGSRKISLGILAPNEEAVHWGADANDLPANGLIGLRVTVVAHGLKTGGSGNAHIDWKKAQSAQSTTRRKVPIDAP